jgi:hypothetical protein
MLNTLLAAACFSVFAGYWLYLAYDAHKENQKAP